VGVGVGGEVRGVFSGAAAFVEGLGSDYLSGGLDGGRGTVPLCFCLMWVKRAG
jgi:hypothetical protein